MAAIFRLPRSTVFDLAGLYAPGGKVRFYQAGTTTPLTVYSDDGLSVPISQPISADAAGLLPLIFLPTGTFKVRVYNASETLIYEEDDIDTGIPAGAGALAVVNGGTGASTASGARSNLGAASQTEVDALASSVSGIEAQITGVGGTLGDLAGLDTIQRAQLGTGFGSVVAKRQLVASTASVVTCSGTIPFDNSIPQNSEGTQFLSGSFTPASGSSTLEIEIIAPATISATNNAAIALFRDTTADALAVCGERFDSANQRTFFLRHRMASWGTSSSTLAVRGGGVSGSLHINGNSSGTRNYGGVLLASMYVTEWVAA
jgi:hypothetical protein